MKGRRIAAVLAAVTVAVGLACRAHAPGAPPLGQHLLGHVSGGDAGNGHA
jgi:hypothetical protein